MPEWVVISYNEKRMWHLESEQILGTPNGSSWSQVHHFLPGEKDKREKRGELILLISLGTANQDQEISSLGREMISRFHEEYFGSLEKKPMDCLREALIKVGQEKSQYFENPQEISMLALISWNNVAYLGIWHHGKVLLRRKGKTVTIAQGEGGQATVVSGIIEEGDIFLLGTKDFFDQVPQGMVTASLSTEDLETIAEVLAPVVHAREKQGSLAAIAAKAVFRPVTEAVVEEEKKEVVRPRLIDLDKLKKKVPKFSFLAKIKKIKFNPLALLKKAHPKAPALTIAFGFLILLGLSVFFGWQKRAGEKKETEISRLSAQIEEKIEAAGAIKNLDPESSLKVINEVEEMIAGLSSLDKDKSDIFQAKVDALKSGLGGEAIEPEVYYDLNLVGEGVRVEDVSLDGTEALILDQGGKRLILLDLKKKSAEIIAGGDKLEGSKLAVNTNDRHYLINEKIFWLKGEDLEETGELEEGDKVIAASGWLGGLYLLDKVNNQIWKYASIDRGLGTRIDWLKAETSLNQAVDLDIDGHIWLLINNGRIYKFLRGGEDKYDQQLPSGVGQAELLAVAKEGEEIVFWDQEKKIIWAFNKEGEFLSRTPIKIDQVKALVISDDGQEIFLFTPDKIYLVKI